MVFVNEEANEGAQCVGLAGTWWAEVVSHTDLFLFVSFPYRAIDRLTLNSTSRVHPLTRHLSYAISFFPRQVIILSVGCETPTRRRGHNVSKGKKTEMLYIRRPIFFLHLRTCLSLVHSFPSPHLLAPRSLPLAPLVTRCPSLLICSTRHALPIRCPSLLIRFTRHARCPSLAAPPLSPHADLLHAVVGTKRPSDASSAHPRRPCSLLPFFSRATLALTSSGADHDGGCGDLRPPERSSTTVAFPTR
jgi:hypothetical protein